VTGQSTGQPALEGLGCCSVPDLFHSLRDLGKHIGARLGRQLSQLEQQISQAKTKLIQLQSESKPPSSKSKNWNRRSTAQQATQTAYHAACSSYRSVCILAISGGEFQSATEVIAALQQQVHRLSTIANAASLPNWQTTVAKFNQQIPAIAAVVNTWWTWCAIACRLNNYSPQTSNWLLTRLLPVVYWQQQLRKTKSLP